MDRGDERVSQWNANGPRDIGEPFFAYSDNYLIDTDHSVIVDVDATRSIRQAEVGATRTMIVRTRDRFGLSPAKLAADAARGSGEMLGWLVAERIELACCRFRGHEDKIVTMELERSDEETNVQPRVQGGGGEAGNGARRGGCSSLSGS